MNKNTTDITLSAYFNDIVIGYYEDEALVKQLGRQLGFDVDMDTFMAVSFQYPSDMNVKPEDRERLTDAAQAVIGLSEINRRITGKQIITCDSGVCVILITHDKAEMRRILDAVKTVAAERWGGSFPTRGSGWGSVPLKAGSRASGIRTAMHRMQ